MFSFGVFNFEQRRNKALGLFQRAVDDMARLVEQTENRAAMFGIRAAALQHESNTLSTDAAKAKTTLDKIAALVL